MTIEGFTAYERASEEWVDPDTDPNQEQKILGSAKIQNLVAEGGPFDGEELTLPPGGSIVILPAAFGKTGDMQGKVIYERRGSKMVYVGQPDQTDEDHTDEDEDGDGLILP